MNGNSSMYSYKKKKKYERKNSFGNSRNKVDCAAYKVDKIFVSNNQQKTETDDHDRRTRRLRYRSGLELYNIVLE